MTVTGAGARAGFGYLNGSFPFSGGAAGPAPFGYLAEPVTAAGATAVTPLLDAAVPHSAAAARWSGSSPARAPSSSASASATSQFTAQFRYLGHGIVSWLTHGVQLGYWRNYLTIDYDDVINADAQWSMSRATARRAPASARRARRRHGADPDEAGRRDATR